MFYYVVKYQETKNSMPKEASIPEEPISEPLTPREGTRREEGNGI